MSGAFTASVKQIKNAPKKIVLLGDKTKKVEPAQHIIEFPGGAIEVSRTEDGNYWAHIIVNNQEVIDDSEGRVSAIGTIIDNRVDGPTGVGQIEGADKFSQIAVLIKVSR